MHTDFELRRTTTADADFQKLVQALDNELWNELKEDQATYDPHNKVSGIKTAVVIYSFEDPVACGCLKPFDKETVEIKRMFVQKGYRRKGLSKAVLTELERWAVEEGYRRAVLETSVHFKTARNLYRKSGYEVVANYSPYVGLMESICMSKDLQKEKA